MGMVCVVDVLGSYDYLMIMCFVGFMIGGYQQLDYGVVVLLLGCVQFNGLVKVDYVEGKIICIFYVVFVGKMGVEVFCNFEDVLEQVGFKMCFVCDGDDGVYGCGGMDFVEVVVGLLYDLMCVCNLMVQMLDLVNGDVYVLIVCLECLVGKVDVLLLVGQNEGELVGVLLQVVEVQLMQIGEVIVDVKVMSGGLVCDGYIVFYGIYFVSDSVWFEKDFDVIFVQMVVLFKVQFLFKVYVVGYIDDIGNFVYNFVLLQQCVEVVVQVFIVYYGIVFVCLVVKGLVFYVLVVSNYDVVGKVKNCCVELVEQ